MKHMNIWCYVIKVCFAYYIFQILKATSQMGSPVLLKFVMGWPEKTHLTTVSRVNATNFTFQTDFELFSPLTHFHLCTYPHYHHYHRYPPITNIEAISEMYVKLLLVLRAFSWSERPCGACLSGGSSKISPEILPCSRQQCRASRELT